MYQGWGKFAGFSGYYVIEFDRSFASYGKHNKSEQPEKNIKVANNQPVAFIRFNTKSNTIVNVKIGTSFTSIKEAGKNLNSEINGWNFDKTEQVSRDKWESNIGKIHIKGGTQQQRINFYTVLYHAF